MHALTTHPLQLLNANIFYPHHQVLLYSDLLLTQSIMALPIYAITHNTIATYNILIFLFYILAAYGAYLLALHYTHHRYAAFIAGLIFGFSTYRIISFHHFQNLSIIFIPFAVLCLQKYIEQWKRSMLIIFTLLFAAQALASWYNGAFLGFLTLYLLAANMKTIRTRLQTHCKSLFIDIAIAGTLFLLLIGPFAYAYMQFNHQEHSAFSIHEVIGYSADLGGYLIPSPYSYPQYLVSWVGLHKERWLENINFLGFAPLLLFIYAIYQRKKLQKESRIFSIYGVGVILFIILSMGPALHLFDQTLKIPLPFFAIQSIPAFQFIRAPSRMAIIVLLCLSIVVAYTIRSIHIKRPVVRYIVALLLPFSILFDAYDTNMANQVVSHVECPAIYDAVRTNPDIQSLVELPFYADPFETVHYIFNSRCHWKPIFNGYSGYLPPDYHFSESVISNFPDNTSIDYLELLGITHVVLHADALPNNGGKMLEQISQQPRVEILHTNNDSDEQKTIIVAIEPDTSEVKSTLLYASDLGSYEYQNPSISLEKNNVLQQSSIGGRTFDGITSTNITGGQVTYSHISTSQQHQLHIALQGQGVQENDIVRAIVTLLDGTVVNTKDIHLQDIFEWKNIAIDIPENVTELNLQLQLLPHEFTDRVVLNSLLIYTN
ncbi:MAG: hypothetical protein HYV32_00770 [Candidatus Kerfeldbacteria bacterium]|nr:hypothetical protein [Candidatus Kerfeldbacteria bacterium]